MPDPTLTHFLDAGRYNTAYVKPVDVLDAERREEDERKRLRALMETSESSVARAEHRKRLLELEQHKHSRKAQMLGTAVLANLSRTSTILRSKSFTATASVDVAASDMSLVGDAFHPTYTCFGCRAPYLFMLGDDKIIEYMRKCTLVAYDVTDNVYILSWDILDEPEVYKERMAQRDRAAAALGLPVQPRNVHPLPLKRLSPLVIRFGGETESAFRSRQSSAYELRDREEALIRLQSFADMTLSAEGSVHKLEDATLEAVLARATKGENIAKKRIVLAVHLLKEVETNHDRGRPGPGS